MGLLTRRRKATGGLPTLPAPVASATPEPNAPLPDREVIRPADLAGPAWSTLPPLRPLLPAMILTASRHFEDDLVARQPPALVLAPLGHSVSASGPAGVVEVASLGSLGVAPDAQQTTSDVPLALAIPVAAPSADELPQAGPRPVVAQPAPSAPSSSRPATDAPPMPLAPTPTPAPTPSVAGPGAVPWTPPTGISPAGAPPPGPPTPSGPPPPAPPASLIGEMPLSVAPSAPAVVSPNPLVHAASPPELPLVQLPATRLPPVTSPVTSPPPGQAAQVGEAGPAQPSAAGQPPAPPPLQASPPASEAGLVGEQALLPPPSTQPPAPPVEGRGADDRGGELPLAATDRPGTPSPPAPMSTPAGPPPDAPRPARQPSASQPSASQPPAEVPPAGPTAPPPPLPLASPPSAIGTPQAPAPPPADLPAADLPAADLPIAPLVGQSAPLPVAPPDEVPDDEGSAPIGITPDQSLPVARRGDQADPPAPPPSRRTGLGAPIAALPPTALSFDPAKVVRQTSTRDAIRSQLERALPHAKAPSAGPTPPGRVGMPLAPSGGPPLEAAARRSDGVPTPGAPTALGEHPTVGQSAFPPSPLAPLSLASRPTVALERVAPEGGAPVSPALRSVRADPVLPITPLQAFLPVPRRAGSVTADAGPPPSEGSAVRLAVGQRHGVDLSQVQVDRSVAGTGQAQRIGARGFSAAAGVVIPAEVGTLDTGPGRSLLTHELTHVAQRARLGPNLPAEHTPAGQALEAEAISAELALAPSGGAPMTPLTGHRDRMGPTSLEPGSPAPATLPLATPPSAGRGGSGMDEAALLSAMQRLSQMGTSTAPGAGPATVVITAPSAPAPAPTPTPVGAGVQRALTFPNVAAAAPPARAPSVGSLFPTKPSDADLSKLARWIYPLISYRIRGELRENRERAGLLTDNYRRW